MGGARVRWLLGHEIPDRPKIGRITREMNVYRCDARPKLASGHQLTILVQYRQSLLQGVTDIDLPRLLSDMHQSRDGGWFWLVAGPEDVEPGQLPV